MPFSEQDYRLSAHLGQYVSEHRKEFVEKVLAGRTRHLTIVLEDIHQSQNASAVVRTCECMGVQDIHIIENTEKYEINRGVLKGSNKWETLIRYRSPGINNTQACFRNLLAKGYTIYATDPGEGNMAIDEIDITRSKIALVFGNEHLGLSDYALQQAHHKVRIPMYGFTESLNISVSVAVCLATLMSRLRGSGMQYVLSDEEKDELRLAWYRKMVKRSDVIEKQFLKTNR